MFNIDNLKQQTNYGAVNNGCPGLFGYHTEDDLSTVTVDGYFPSSTLDGMVGNGDLIAINAADGIILRAFDSNCYLISVV